MEVSRTLNSDVPETMKGVNPLVARRDEMEQLAPPLRGHPDLHIVKSISTSAPRRRRNSLVNQKHRRLPVACTNVLAQEREATDPEHIQGIASNMEELGMLQDPMAIIFTERTALERYLKYWNALYADREVSEGVFWHREVEDLVEWTGHPGCWIILVFGEHRYSARVLQGRKWIEVKVRYNVRPRRGADIQVSENSAKIPAPEERAKYLDKCWRMDQLLAHPPTLKTFANKKKVSEQTVRDAIRYSRLPQWVEKDHVKKGHIRYRHAVEIARLVGTEHDENRMHYYIQRTIVGGWKPEDLAKKISEYLKNLKQNSFAMMVQDPSDDRHIRALIARRDLRATREGLRWAKGVTKAIQDGTFDNVLVPRSVSRFQYELAEHLLQALPHSPKGREASEAIRRAMDDFLVPLHAEISALLAANPVDIAEHERALIAADDDVEKIHALAVLGTTS